MNKLFNYKAFLALIILILTPVDFFFPSANLLREAGAKPLNLFIILFLFIYILITGKVHPRELKYKIHINRYLYSILFFGTFAFFFNIFYFDYPLSNRTPEFQFFSQFLMFFLFILVFNSLKFILSNTEIRLLILKILPLAVFIHLSIFILEYLNIYNPDNPSFLRFFRNSAGLIDRASGLMSEPAYFGTFAGLFIFPLLLLCRQKRALNLIMAFALAFFSVTIQAKTFFIVILMQVLYFILGLKKSFKIKIISGFLILILLIAGLYIVNTSLVFNVDENLSSAMRLGSNLLALNVATSGYGLLGIGFGQFHFFYTPEFSPNFLMFSKEALDQMNNVNDSRASTFSLPLRILVETGIFGFITSVMLIYGLFKKFHISKDPVTQLGMFFIFGSIGFLLTQDSYCLPSLALGLALVCTQPQLKS